MFQILGFPESPAIVKLVFTVPNLHWIMEMILQASHLQQQYCHYAFPTVLF